MCYLVKLGKVSVIMNVLCGEIFLALVQKGCEEKCKGEKIHERRKAKADE